MTSTNALMQNMHAKECDKVLGAMQAIKYQVAVMVYIYICVYIYIYIFTYTYIKI